MASANETAQLLALLEAVRLSATIVVLRDRLASLEPWSSVHPLFRWGVRNSSSTPVRIVVISTYEQDTYRAWLRAADGVLLFDGSAPDVVLAWHRIALSGGWLALGPSVRHAGLPQSIIRSSSVAELFGQLKDLIETGAVSQKRATKEEASRAPPKSLELLVQLIQRASPSPVSQLSAEQLHEWVEQQAQAIGWTS